MYACTVIYCYLIFYIYKGQFSIGARALSIDPCYHLFVSSYLSFNLVYFVVVSNRNKLNLTKLLCHNLLGIIKTSCWNLSEGLGELAGFLSVHTEAWFPYIGKIPGSRISRFS